MHTRGYYVFPSKNSGLTVQKKFVVTPSMFHRNWGMEKFYASEREGGITFLCRKLLSHSTKNFRWGTVRCFRKFRVSQEFLHSKAISLNSVEKFLSHSADKIPRRTICLSNEFCYQKFSSNGGGELHCFVEKFFFSHRTEKFHQGTVLCSTKFWEQKSFCGWEGGVNRIFRRKVFVSLCQKISLEKNFAFQKIFYIENFHANERGGHHGSVEIFCLTGSKQKVL